MAARLLLGAALLAITTSCSRLRHDPEGDAQEPPEPVMVVFVNQSLSQADVFALLSSGSTVRMGTVLPGMTSSLRVPTSISSVGSINVMARLLAGRLLLRTGAVSVSPGDHIQVTLPMDTRSLTVMPNP